MATAWSATTRIDDQVFRVVGIELNTNNFHSGIMVGQGYSAHYYVGPWRHHACRMGVVF